VNAVGDIVQQVAEVGGLEDLIDGNNLQTLNSIGGQAVFGSVPPAWFSI
jgi:hypothetical protein